MSIYFELIIFVLAFVVGFIAAIVFFVGIMSTSDQKETTAVAVKTKSIHPLPWLKELLSGRKQKKRKRPKKKMPELEAHEDEDYEDEEDDELEDEDYEEDEDESDEDKTSDDISSRIERRSTMDWTETECSDEETDSSSVVKAKRPRQNKSYRYVKGRMAGKRGK